MTSSPASAVRIVDVAYSHEFALPLITAHLADLAQRYGSSGDDLPVSDDEFFPPRGAFFLAIVDDEVAGCAGIRRVSDSRSVGHHPAVEMKRLYVKPEFRRRGVASELVRICEMRARAMGIAALLLESGTKQPEALAFYEQRGYTRVSGFGHYAGHDDQRAMVKDLRDSAELRR